MNIALIFAGGVGKRMTGSGIPKQFLNLLGKPIIIHTLNHFQHCDEIDAIVIVMVETHLKEINKLVSQYNLSKVKKIVSGGTTGQLSIYNGLCAAKEISTSDKDIILIHDGVRPIIDEKLILNNINSVKQFGSAISCIPQKETTVIVDSDLKITRTTIRDETFIARAPQSFYLNEILELHNKCLSENVIDMTDSCSMMLKFNKELHIVKCQSDNIKITTPDDFYIAKAILEAKENKSIFGG